MVDLLMAQYGVNQVNLHFTTTTFTPGQATYHIRWDIKFNSQEQYFEWELTPNTAQIPACRIGLGRNIDVTAYPFYEYNLATPPTCYINTSCVLGASSGHPLGVLSATLTDSGGDTIINMSGWNSPDDATLVGDVSNCNLDITVTADFPIFATEFEERAAYYGIGTCAYYMSLSDDNDNVDNCVSGDMSAMVNAVNYNGQENEIPKNVTYSIENRLKKNGSIIETKIYRFQIKPGAKIYLVADEHDNTGQTYNMHLYISGSGLTFKYKSGNAPSWTVAHLLTPTLSSYYYGTWTDYNNGDLYVTINKTNIPIFRTVEEGEAYEQGLIDETDAINIGEGGHYISTTGSDLDETDIPNITVGASGVGCNVWALSKSQLNNVMNVLFDDTQTVIDDIKDGTWLWGNNPIDFIISCYFVPLDVSDFYTVSDHSLYLGWHDTTYDYPRVSESKSSGQRATLCTTSIDPVYNDWRDFAYFKYEVYLPFIGFYPLDIASYMGKMLKIELAFDIMSHNIRYYLFANDKIIDRVDGSVGYDIPLLATDQVNKAKSDLTGLQQMFGGVGEIAGVASGMGGSVSNGISSLISGVQNMAKYPSVQIAGNISSSMNIYDITYCYLKITEKDHIKPSQLNIQYNYPSYYIGNVSALSGYCEFADLRFSSTATDVEVEEIMSLVKQGIIL